MVAMARYLAGLPGSCRPRSIEFVFPTAHFYQRLVDLTHRYGGAGVIATQLDAEYDQGKVSSVLTLEHLGAIDYEQMPRSDGGPGSELMPNGLRAIQFIGITPSPSLVAAVSEVVRSYNMERTILLQGARRPRLDRALALQLRRRGERPTTCICFRRSARSPRPSRCMTLPLASKASTSRSCTTSSSATRSCSTGSAR